MIKALFGMWVTPLKILYNTLMMWSYTLLLPLSLIVGCSLMLKDYSKFFEFGYTVFYAWIVGLYQLQIVLLVLFCAISIKNEL